MISRILGLDYGEKRIGIALSDPLGLTAQAHPFLPNDENTITTLKALMDEYDVETIVVGNPKNRFGEDSEKSKEVKAFMQGFETEIDCKIVYVDERYSTQAVERHLIEANVSRKKRKAVVDSAAAAFILEGYLHTLNHAK